MERLVFISGSMAPPSGRIYHCPCVTLKQIQHCQDVRRSLKQSLLLSAAVWNTDTDFGASQTLNWHYFCSVSEVGAVLDDHCFLMTASNKPGWQCHHPVRAKVFVTSAQDVVWSQGSNEGLTGGDGIILSTWEPSSDNPSVKLHEIQISTASWLPQPRCKSNNPQSALRLACSLSNPQLDWTVGL